MLPWEWHISSIIFRWTSEAESNMMSSAYAMQPTNKPSIWHPRSEAFKAVIIELKYMLNRKGDRILPCLMPLHTLMMNWNSLLWTMAHVGLKDRSQRMKVRKIYHFLVLTITWCLKLAYQSKFPGLPIRQFLMIVPIASCAGSLQIGQTLIITVHGLQCTGVRKWKHLSQKNQSPRIFKDTHSVVYGFRAMGETQNSCRSGTDW